MSLVNSWSSYFDVPYLSGFLFANVRKKFAEFLKDGYAIPLIYSIHPLELVLVQLLIPNCFQFLKKRKSLKEYTHRLLFSHTS